MKKINPEIKQKWLAALRSGEYKQGISVLRSYENNEYCCLGVLCDLAVKEGVIPEPDFSEECDCYYYDRNYETLPTAVSKWANFNSSNGRYGSDHGENLAWDNDALGKSFEEIANIIEEKF